MRCFFALVLASLFIPIFTAGQTPHQMAIRAGRLIDRKSDKPVEKALILIESDKIASVTAAEYDEQLLKESIPYRVAVSDDPLKGITELQK